ncbi:hypothetical protein V8F20_005362 [Naviculisporaceae sp. PSN 640]
MESDSKLCVVEAEMGQLAISPTEAAGKLPEPVSTTTAVTVTIQELPPSPGLTCNSVSSPLSPEPITEFHLFPLLPAELRLKIWHFSFLLSPRTIELHARRTHYAADNENHYSGIGAFGNFSGASRERGGGGGERGPPPKWQSQSRNPAAMSVSAEARFAALEFYRVRLPLAYNPADHTIAQRISATALDRGSEWENRTSSSWAKYDDLFVRERPGDLLSSSDRVIYLNPETDMVALLGDLHFGRLSRLLNWFRDQDASTARRGQARGKASGLRRLAMSVAPFSHQVGAATLQAFARTVFGDVDEFVLFMYMGRVPPEEWNGGKVVLEDCKEDDDEYRRFLMGRGGQFRSPGGWMVVGKSPLRMADIRFENGW